MKHLMYRNTKIVNELMNYCYKHGSQNININVITKNQCTEFHIKAFDISLREKDVFLLEKLLSAKRSHELEEHYWILAGDNDTDPELTLIGIMTDTSSVKYSKDNTLEIYLERLG
ncbi:hypothetical protein [Clostridium algidicarnis]|uniref:hypothetical protein n=1 Tax=Clostridium algidicarnis TaxID=37659 RepID=UPI001C0D7753|nr:hypothetical protein [Clostridium algidicarnis]MBU3210697.1 hypothetical protein [Clostridium algidicarnis]MBU3229233.1 hypothetical protein [Clostridium algidicarnis]MBU3252747.1 hypothetical protein [Clostridium algidicarnis]